MSYTEQNKSVGKPEEVIAHINLSKIHRFQFSANKDKYFMFGLLVGAWNFEKFTFV